MKNTFLIALILLIFPIPGNGIEYGIKDIYGNWILVDVKDGNRMQYQIGLLKLKISEQAFEMESLNIVDGGPYTAEKDLISFKSKMRKDNTVFQLSRNGETLVLQEPGEREMMYFKKGVKPDFLINTGEFDDRFASPEKTYTLFKKLLTDRKISLATECLIPTMAGLYHKNFTELIKENQFEGFLKGLPDTIVFSSEYDPYYDYNLISEVDGKRRSFPVQFVKQPSGIFLLYHL